jgi:hypothetical protein
MARLRTTDSSGRVFNAYSPVITLKHNAVRAARRALGAGAQPGVDFTLESVEGGWTWSAGVEAPKDPLELAERVEAAPAKQHQAPPKTVEELLERIAIEHSLEGARAIIQALHTAYAEGAIAGKPKKKPGPRKSLFLFQEPLTAPCDRAA